MGMTRSEKILARASGKARVAPGDMVVGQADVMMGNDITAALTIRILEEHGITKFADPDKVFIVMSHFVPAKDIASAAMARACRDFARKYEIQHYFEAGQGGIEHALLPAQPRRHQKSAHWSLVPGQTVSTRNSGDHAGRWFDAAGEEKNGCRVSPRTEVLGGMSPDVFKTAL